MRIIGGNLKNKKLFFSSSTTTRPLRDLVKESIFNVITHSKLINIKIENSEVLDLYSGVGSFGIECISREVKRVTFVENNNNSLKFLKKNLKELSIEDKAYLFSQNINLFISKIDRKNKFDIFFMDPPFAENDYIDQLKIIRKMKIYKPRHIVIIHRESRPKEKLDDVIKILIEKKYGRSKIIFGIFS